MVFSSTHLYLDPPNWQQQQQQGAHTENSQLQLPPPPVTTGGGGGGIGSIRPNSMSERARLAKIPQPETALKCPRCESTNTKFCYFNNYNLSQPRHLCKTCRRYWTRGGALRNVPVGGGCRRNKRGKKTNSRSKSPAVTTAEFQAAAAAGGGGGSSSSTDIISHMSPPQSQLQLPIFPPLHHFSDYNLNFGGGSSSNDVDFQIGSGSSTSGLFDQWRSQQQQVVQQFPFMAGLESQTGSYPSLETETQPSYASQFLSKEAPMVSSAGVKMEENQGLNLLSRNFLGIPGNDHQFWGTSNNAWTDLPGFTSSSTTHLL